MHQNSAKLVKFSGLCVSGDFCPVIDTSFFYCCLQVYMAKLAEQAERYDGTLYFWSDFIENGWVGNMHDF